MSLSFPAPRTLSALSLSVLLAACGGGSGSNDYRPIEPRPGPFIVLNTYPPNNGQLYLNESLAFEFSKAIDPTSADFNAVSFAVFDLLGKQLSESVEGSFHVTAATGDDQIGRRLEFRPTFPTNDSFGNGGFKPGRKYIVNLVKGDHRRNVGLLDTSGKGLDTAHSFTFQTADGTTPSQLFKDTKPGGPRRVALDVFPKDGRTGEVDLNELGQSPTEIRLRFDQPLNPHSANVPARIDLDPRTRSIAGRGRIFLEYDDVAGASTWIPASVTLEANTLEGATVVLRPLGILPNNAEIRVIVESTVEDISGESNVSDPAFDRVFGEFRTNSSYELRFDALVEDFLSTRHIDFEAPFLEPLAEVGNGVVRANLDFEGGTTNLDFEPNTREVVLDTDFTQVTPKNGQPINVRGGIFNFRNVTIPRGVTVRGTGSNPMVWLVTGDFVVEGDLIVNGGQGQRVNTLNSANFPAGGGTANCGGGRGGEGSPIATDRSRRGGHGYGPGEVPNGGGKGGRINCADSTCGRGSGGGGGSFVTAGDPYYKLKSDQYFVQPNGHGAYGCVSRTSKRLKGGEPGPVAFTDEFKDNDFWGAAVDISRGLRITGELRAPRGGGGGGGGGDNAVSCQQNDPNFVNDDKAGGGGAGGGVLIIKCLGSFEVRASGHVQANGGNGGGGAWAGSCNRAGGGGAGAGGMIVVMVGDKIVLHTHGETYAKNDYDYSLSADGGVGLLDTYASGGIVRGKYPPTSKGNMNARPTGGFGGLGLIQLMAPPGSNPAADGTNTLLDNNIIVLKGGSELKGADKQRYLAWRGMRDASGVYRDDDGKRVTIGDAVGDIRPAPLLLPAPFGNVSRVRSRWIDLGASNRRVTKTGGDDLPRGVELQPGTKVGQSFGPSFEFAAVVAGDQNSTQAGFVAVRDDQVGGVVIDYPTVLSDLPVASVRREQPIDTGRAPTFRVELRAPSAALGAQANRYAHYTAVLKLGREAVGRARILRHTDRVLHLSVKDDALASNSGGDLRLDVQARFFDVFTSGVEGFPQTFVGRDAKNHPQGVRVPRANVRIRFAFHQDPSDPTAKRYPPQAAGESEKFFADWGDASVLDAIRKDGYRFVRYDILFDTQYEWDAKSFPNRLSLSPESPRPELRRLVLPYRY